MAKQKLDAPMTRKIRIEQPQREKESVFSMVIGTVLVALGLLLFVTGVVMLVLFNLPPRENTEIASPTLYDVPSATNTRSISIKGETEYDKVMVWVNDDLVAKSLEVKDGKFEFVYPVETEGEYLFQVSAIKGFPLRYRSPKTSGVLVEADWTAPSNQAQLTYKKSTDRSVFSISGTVEDEVFVTLSRNGKEYTDQADLNGVFAIKNIPLKAGKNEFSVVLKDEAGNVTKLDKNVIISYVLGDINGDGISDTNLPVSAGNFFNENIFKSGNSLMALFGLLALGAMGTSTLFVLRRARKVSV